MVSYKGVLFKVYQSDINNGRFTIPEGIHCIRGYAFDGCVTLTDVTIPDSITKIESRAFCSCPLSDECISNIYHHMRYIKGESLDKYYLTNIR